MAKSVHLTEEMNSSNEQSFTGEQPVIALYHGWAYLTTC